MSMIQPKTIVISGITNKVHLNPNQIYFPQSTEMETDVNDDDIVIDGIDGVRKRKRLTHLSQEERMLRRKLKNRVAAQTARDRKKARMEELEEAMTKLEAENKKLQNENLHLHKKTECLLQENCKMKAQLDGDVVVTVEKSQNNNNDVAMVGGYAPPESAAGEGAYPPQLDNTLSRVSHDSQCDQLLGILEQISEITSATATTSPETSSTTSDHENLVSKIEETSSGEMVGPTTEELESIKELIHFDHIYYKQEDTVPVVENNVASLNDGVVVITQNARVRVENKIVNKNGLSYSKNKSTVLGSNVNSMDKSKSFVNLKPTRVVKLLPKSRIVQDKNAVSILKPNIHTTELSVSKNTKGQNNSQNLSTQNGHEDILPIDIKEEFPLKLEFNENDLDWLSQHFENELSSQDVTSEDIQSCNDCSSLNHSNSLNGLDSNIERCGESSTIIADMDNILNTTSTTQQRKRKASVTSTVIATSVSQSTKAFKNENGHASPTTSLSLELPSHDFEPFDFINNFNGISSESGYGSDRSDIGSPKSDSSFDLGEETNIWEESFTDLFPNLLN